MLLAPTDRNQRQPPIQVARRPPAEVVREAGAGSFGEYKAQGDRAKDFLLLRGLELQRHRDHATAAAPYGIGSDDVIQPTRAVQANASARTDAAALHLSCNQGDGLSQLTIRQPICAVRSENGRLLRLSSGRVLEQVAEVERHV